MPSEATSIAPLVAHVRSAREAHVAVGAAHPPLAGALHIAAGRFVGMAVDLLARQCARAVADTLDLDRACPSRKVFERGFRRTASSVAHNTLAFPRPDEESYHRSHGTGMYPPFKPGAYLAQLGCDPAWSVRFGRLVGADTERDFMSTCYEGALDTLSTRDAPPSDEELACTMQAVASMGFDRFVDDSLRLVLPPPPEHGVRRQRRPARPPPLGIPLHAAPRNPRTAMKRMFCATTPPVMVRVTALIALWLFAPAAHGTLDSFLRRFLAVECVSLATCPPVRHVAGYDTLTNHERAQAVTTRLLRAFAFLFEELGVPWVPYAGTLLGLVRHDGWIPWDHDMDILMRHNDTFLVARNLHRLPADMGMVHPLVDGAVMGQGIYKNQCPGRLGYGWRADGTAEGPVECRNVRSWSQNNCLYASLRDLNSCRPGTNNIMNGLSVDIFVPPRARECGDDTFDAALLRLQRTVHTWHGWRMPAPVMWKTMLTHRRFDDFGSDFMRADPGPLEMTNVDVERACSNRKTTVHVQPMQCNNGWCTRASF